MPWQALGSVAVNQLGPAYYRSHVAQEHLCSALCLGSELMDKGWIAKENSFGFLTEYSNSVRNTLFFFFKNGFKTWVDNAKPKAFPCSQLLLLPLSLPYSSYCCNIVN